MKKQFENEGGRCIPSPAILEWIDFINVASQGGVCEGMTVFSASRFLLQDSPETVDLSLNSVVSTGINRLFATQFLDEVIDQTQRWQQGSVNNVVNELVVSLSDVSHEQYTLGIYTDVSGHSLLPYAVEMNVDGTGGSGCMTLIGQSRNGISVLISKKIFGVTPILEQIRSLIIKSGKGLDELLI